MNQFTITSPTNPHKVVIVTEQGGTFEGRVYVNEGQTAGHTHNTTRTRAGIERWAKRVLA